MQNFAKNIFCYLLKIKKFKYTIMYNTELTIKIKEKEF